VSVLPILIYGHPALARVAERVPRITGDIRALAADMIDTMYDAPGRGLAAPQVGVPLRLFVMDCHWKDGAPRDPRVCINPEISDASTDMAENTDVCLSIPGVAAPVTRPSGITLRWTGLDGQAREQRLTGIAATCAQHEYDHLDGILTPDRLTDTARAGIQARLDALQSTHAAA
jgi:peptide deformylase